MTPFEALSAILSLTPPAIEHINDFSRDVLRTRGGRFGSGMGTLLEALWGYYINQQLSSASSQTQDIEIAWLLGHEYNDFACVMRNEAWEPETKSGELLRIEAKSMNIGVDESKGHFDEIAGRLGEWDLLVILLWVWEPVEGNRVYPWIKDHFIGQARPIANLRDRLHIARGGTFVDRTSCPDGCTPVTCQHHGEPLNEQGRRERISGPLSRRPSNTSFAANFGGLVRMLKTSTQEARQTFGTVRAEDLIAHSFITFIHRNYPSEESNQYLLTEWRTLADKYELGWEGLSKGQLIERIQLRVDDYQEELRHIRG